MNYLTTSSLLDSIVLAILSKGDAYGYIITQEVMKTMDVSESALYPALRRLQKDGLLEAYDETESGRNRRYYKVTPAGRTKLKEYLDAWTDSKSRIDNILGGAVIE